MPAQVILLDAAAPGSTAEAERDQPVETKPPEEPSKPKPKYPKWRPINMATVLVVGQKPHELGHFDSMTALAKAVHDHKLPGGSNTVFATVKHIRDLNSEMFHATLGKLPDALTIIVRPGGPDA
ncbi:MAG TPA: hypothetical protein VKX28_23985 [Xanthobacteraceae bacterium]|nr:hypothetical protein [Xanthobacteraceae bacterium]